MSTFHVAVGVQVIKEFRYFLVFEKLKLHLISSCITDNSVISISYTLYHLAKDAEHSLRIRHFLKDADGLMYFNVILTTSENPKHAVAEKSTLNGYLDCHRTKGHLGEGLDYLRTNEETSGGAGKFTYCPIVNY